MLIKLIRPILKDEYNIIVNFKKYYIQKKNDQERKLIRSLQKMELIEETFI